MFYPQKWTPEEEESDTEDESLVPVTPDSKDGDATLAIEIPPDEPPPEDGSPGMMIQHLLTLNVNADSPTRPDMPDLMFVDDADLSPDSAAAAAAAAGGGGGGGSRTAAVIAAAGGDRTPDATSFLLTVGRPDMDAEVARARAQVREERAAAETAIALSRGSLGTLGTAPRTAASLAKARAAAVEMTRGGGGGRLGGIEEESTRGFGGSTRNLGSRRGFGSSHKLPSTRHLGSNRGFTGGGSSVLSGYTTPLAGGYTTPQTGYTTPLTGGGYTTPSTGAPLTSRAGAGRMRRGSVMLSSTSAQPAAARRARRQSQMVFGAPARANEVLAWTKGDLLYKRRTFKVFRGINLAGGVMEVKDVPLQQFRPGARDGNGGDGDTAGDGGETKAGAVAAGGGGGVRGGGSTSVTLQVAAMNAMAEEIKFARSLEHPHLVQYLGTELGEESFFFLREMVSGSGSISEMTAQFGGLHVAVIKRYTRDILRGLQALHAAGVVHGALRGRNTRIDSSGTVKLVDYGLVKPGSRALTIMIDGCDNPDDDEAGVGDLPWLAPEVVRDKVLTPASDVWSLGCVVIEMGGKRPWQEYTRREELKDHLSMQRGPPTESAISGLSGEAMDFIDCCCHLDQRKRHSVDKLLNHSFLRDESKATSF